ncbi:MAG: DNA internalization-related competence protein ComEC/Rec2 [Candidatus Omnitrophota bacterium]
MKYLLLVPIIFFLAGILAAKMWTGVVASSYVPVSVLLSVLLAGLIVVLVLLAAGFKRQKFFYFLLCVFFFFLGVFRYESSAVPGKHDISNYISEVKEEMLVYGTVTGSPERKMYRFGRYGRLSRGVDPEVPFLHGEYDTLDPSTPPLRGSARDDNSLFAARDDNSLFAARDDTSLSSRLSRAKPRGARGRSDRVEGSNFILKTEKLLTGGKELPVSGDISVNLYGRAERPLPGDRLVAGGKISSIRRNLNPAAFDYRAYLDNSGVRGKMTVPKNGYYLRASVSKNPVLLVLRALCIARGKADAILRQYLNGQPGAVMRSVVLGLRGGITEETKDTFVKTGTMHMLAVSGLHVGIAAAAVMGLLTFAGSGRVTVYLSAIIAVCAFAALTGARPSAVRAAIMLTFVLAGKLLERDTRVIDALAASAFLITFFMPSQLFMPGFILSYAAVLSIIYVTPLTDTLFGIEKRTLREKRSVTVRRYLLKPVSLSFAIWIGMAPLSAAYFHLITPSVVISNLLAVPALFCMVILGFMLISAGMAGFFLPVTLVIAYVSDGLIRSLIGALDIIRCLPMAFIRVAAPNLALIAVFYTVLAGAIVLYHYGKKNRIPAAAFVLFAANIFIWNEAVRVPPDSMRATFFDTGKADAAVMEFSDGSTVLVDGASSEKGAGRNILAPYLWQRRVNRVDCIILTHAHEDHIGGLLYILENFDVGTVIDGSWGETDKGSKKLYNDFLEKARKKGVRCVRVKAGDIIKGPAGSEIMVFNPPSGNYYGNMNDDSLVIKLITVNGNSILFCADAGAEAMEDMLRFGPLLKSDIIKIPHHGGKLGGIAAVRAFLSEVNGAAAVITSDDPGSLNKDVRKILNSFKVKVYVTGISGAITVEDTANGFNVKEYQYFPSAH